MPDPKIGEAHRGDAGSEYDRAENAPAGHSTTTLPGLPCAIVWLRADYRGGGGGRQQTAGLTTHGPWRHGKSAVIPAAFRARCRNQPAAHRGADMRGGKAPLISAFTLVAGMAVLLLLGGLAAAQPATPLLAKHQAAGVTCATCHPETPPATAVQAPTCLGCHGDAAKLAAATWRAAPNPHAPSHLVDPASPQCDICHHLHRPSENACVRCHKGFVFQVP
jgi:hypothetical protein